MTRVSGITVTRCAHCGQQYQQPAYSSINLMHGKVWSDGRREYPLYHPGSPIHRCTCGQVVLRSAFVADAARQVVPSLASQLPKLQDTEVPDEALAGLIQRKIMQGLLEFTMARMALDWFCTMALQRELGQFDAAQATCKRWNVDAEWEQFATTLQEGDELWAMRSLPSVGADRPIPSPNHGYAILRGGLQIAAFWE